MKGNGGEIMAKRKGKVYSNLAAEMARNCMTMQDLAARAGITYKVMQNRLSGKTDFTLTEIKTIKGIFQDLAIEYLFARED